MTDEQALIAEASDVHTPPRRLHQLIDHPNKAVKFAALANPSFDIRELAMRLNVRDSDDVETAIDAIIARPQEFQYVTWDEPRALDLVPARLTEKLDGMFVVSDETFEAFARGWSSATAAAIAFDIMDRASIVDLFLHEEFADEDEDEDATS
jgi:hypothetical protein